MPYDPHSLYGSLTDGDLAEYDDSGFVGKSYKITPRVNKIEKKGHKAAVNGVALSSVTCTNAGDVLGKTAHGLTTGQRVTAASFSAGLTAGTYYVIRVDADTFQLATTHANAQNGIATAISADGTGGVITPVTPASYRQILQVQVDVIGAEIEMMGEPIPDASGHLTGLARVAPGEHLSSLANFQDDVETHGIERDTTKLLLVGEISHSRSPENPAEITIPATYYPEIAAPAA